MPSDRNDDQPAYMPPPGSYEAVQRGCTCPRVANTYGFGLPEHLKEDDAAPRSTSIRWAVRSTCPCRPSLGCRADRRLDDDMECRCPSPCPSCASGRKAAEFWGVIASAHAGGTEAVAEDPKARRYLDELATFCPFCEDTDADNRMELRTYRPDPKQGKPPALEVEWRCNICSGRWTEVFKLVGVCWEKTKTFTKTFMVGAGEVIVDEPEDMT